MTEHSMDYGKIALSAGRHAIESASFSMAFSDNLTRADFARFDEKRKAIENEFPSIQPMQSFTLKVTPEKHDFMREPKGQELSEFGRDGKQIWSAIFVGNSIQLTCHAYTRWSEVWSTAKRKLFLLLDCVDQKKEVIAIDLSVVDSFSANMSEIDMVPSTVLRSDSPYVSKNIMDLRDARWDLQQGWFEDTQGQFSKLTRLDCRSVRRNDRHILSIQNVLSMRSNEPHRTLSEYVAESGGSCRLDTLLDGFHSDNKDILRNLLVNALQDRMGLKEE